jgi:hypothetical protein
MFMMDPKSPACAATPPHVPTSGLTRPAATVLHPGQCGGHEGSIPSVASDGCASRAVRDEAKRVIALLAVTKPSDLDAAVPNRPGVALNRRPGRKEGER